MFSGRKEEKAESEGQWKSVEDKIDLMIGI